MREKFWVNKIKGGAAFSSQGMEKGETTTIICLWDKMKGVSGGDIKDTRVIKLYKAKRPYSLSCHHLLPPPQIFRGEATTQRDQDNVKVESSAATCEE